MISVIGGSWMMSDFTLPLGLVCFGITLHCGNANVMILPGNNGGIRDVEGDVVELESQKMLPQNNSEDV